MSVIELEIDTPTNGELVFKPFDRRVRGRIDFNRMGNPNAHQFTRTYPKGIPGQVIGTDGKTCWIREPLHESENVSARHEIAKKYELPPEREEFPCDVPTFLYWCCRAVEGGLAHVVKGTLPDRSAIKGKPRKFFHTPEPQLSETRVQNALRWISLTAEQKKEVAELLGGDPF